jgi:hypothetical protein
LTIAIGGRGLDGTSAETWTANDYVELAPTRLAFLEVFNAAVVSIGALTPAADRYPYYTSATAAALGTITAFARTVLDDADAATARTTLGALASAFLRGLCTGRLTLSSGVPVTIVDITGATTVYFTPYGGNNVAIRDGSGNWNSFTFSELSVAVPATTNTPFDVFIKEIAGVLSLETTSWTNDTTRATAVVRVDGVPVSNADSTKRYLGTLRTASVSGQTEDSAAKRFCWNYYNRVDRPMLARESTNSWAYTTSAYRQVNGAAANKVEFVVGLQEDPDRATARTPSDNTTPGTLAAEGNGLDSTTVNSAQLVCGQQINSATMANWLSAHYEARPSVGYHYLAWLEYSEATGTTTWYGDNGIPDYQQAGIAGSVTA